MAKPSQTNRPFCRQHGPFFAALFVGVFGFACNQGGDKDSAANVPAANEPNNATIEQPIVPAVVEPTSPNNAVSPNTAANANVAAQPNSNVKAIAWPSIDFVNNPGGNDPKAVALSFDDGPDSAGGNSNTSYVLDQLDALQLKATFFVCGNRSTDVLNDPKAIADVKRIVSSGHAIGNHTYAHERWNRDLSTQGLKDAITLNEKVFQDPRVLGPNFQFTMWRSPYGTPFQDGNNFPIDPVDTAAVVNLVAPYSPPNAVHVGWGIDSRDWLCVESAATNNSNCIITNVNTFLERGASGVILMHSIHKLTGDTLPQLVATIKAHGYHIVQVEDFIKAKYGASSADIAAANKAKTFDAATLGAAALASTKKSKWYLNLEEN